MINAYGNVKLLLQNKIANLDKLNNLEKVKGDEKIGIALAKIINMMTELKTLVRKHNLDYKLCVRLSGKSFEPRRKKGKEIFE